MGGGGGDDGVRDGGRGSVMGQETFYSLLLHPQAFSCVSFDIVLFAMCSHHKDTAAINQVNSRCSQDSLTYIIPIIRNQLSAI